MSSLSPRLIVGVGCQNRISVEKLAPESGVEVRFRFKSQVSGQESWLDLRSIVGCRSRISVGKSDLGLGVGGGFESWVQVECPRSGVGVGPKSKVRVGSRVDI